MVRFDEGRISRSLDDPFVKLHVPAKELQCWQLVRSDLHLLAEIPDSLDFAGGGPYAGKLAGERLQCADNIKIVDDLVERGVGYVRTPCGRVFDQPFSLGSIAPLEAVSG